jgi:mono/diheme cytochrome c family protein
MNKPGVLGAILLTVAAAAMLPSCSDKRSPGWEYARNMYDPIAPNPDSPNKFLRNGQAAQTPPEHTMPVGFDEPETDYPNTMEGYLAAGANMKNPVPATAANLEEGKMLYAQMCTQCHGLKGQGDGSIVKMEKFPPPPSYSSGQSSRGGAMKDLTDGKIFHTITYGVNLMGPHRYQLTPTERWKIVLYIHELQKQ